MTMWKNVSISRIRSGKILLVSSSTGYTQTYTDTHRQTDRYIDRQTDRQIDR